MKNPFVKRLIQKLVENTITKPKVKPKPETKPQTAPATKPKKEPGIGNPKVAPYKDPKARMSENEKKKIEQIAKRLRSGK